MKNVLFIAYLYPPIANSGTQRSLKFTKFLSNFGWAPIVLTIKNPLETELDMSLMSEIPANVEVFRCHFSCRSLLEKLFRYLPIRLKNKLVDIFEWRLRRKYSFPDIHADWIKEAVATGVKLYKQQPYRVIYATGYPWSSFVVAKKLSIVLDLPYVIDYRDLWTEQFARWDSTLKQDLFALECNLEKELISSASAVIATTSSQLNLIKDKIVEGDRFYKTIENGFDPEDFLDIHSDRNHKNHGTIRIGYTGVWKDDYSPALLIQAAELINSVSRKIKIEIETAGYLPDLSEYLHVPNLKLIQHGRVDHKKALEIMARCDLLFLTVPSSEYSMYQLPGKLFEYLASKTPILATVPIASEVAKVLNTVGGGLVIPNNDINSIVNTLTDFIESDFNNIPKLSQIELSKFERKNLAAKLADIFDQVTAS